MSNKVIYEHMQKISFDNGETWNYTHIKTFLYYDEIKTKEITYIKDFATAQKLISDGVIFNARNTVTTFRHKPQIYFWWVSLTGEMLMTEKQFKPIFVVNEYVERNDLTMEELMKILPADEMIEYLKDNGLNVCPIVR